MRGGDGWNGDLNELVSRPELPMAVAVVAALRAGQLALRRRRSPGAPAFAVTMFAMAVWAACEGFEAGSITRTAKLFWSDLVFVPVGIGPVALLQFSAAFTHRPRWRRDGVIAGLSLLPLFTALMAACNSWHGWIWPSVTYVATPRPHLDHSNGWLFVAFAAYSYALCGLAVSWLLAFARRSPAPYRQQGWLLAAAGAAPCLGTLLYLLNVSPWPGIDLGPLGGGLSGLLAAYSLTRYRCLDLVPLARDALLAQLPEAVLAFDGSGRLIDVNRNAQRLFGAQARLGEAASALLGDWPELHAQWREAPAVSTDVARPGAVSAWFAVTASPLDDGDGRSGRLLVLRDVTATREAAEERRQLERALQEAHHLESLGILAGGLAHDFNNLHTVVMGHLELLMSHLDPHSSAHDSAERAFKATCSAAALTAEMLAYAGAAQYHTAPADLAAFVRCRVALLGSVVSGGIELRLELSEPVPAVNVDDSSLQHVLLHLVTNAREALGETPRALSDTPGGVVVGVRTVELGRGELDAAENGADLPAGPYVELSVADDGPGMDAETRARMFHPFFSTRFLGRGLGLAAVLGIVKAHGGAIDVRSAPGQGTRLAIWLPVAGATAGSPAGLTAGSPPPA